MVSLAGPGNIEELTLTPLLPVATACVNRNTLFSITRTTRNSLLPGLRSAAQRANSQQKTGSEKNHG